MKKNSSLVSSILLIIIGLILLFNSSEMLVTISYIIGSLMVLFGIYEIFKFKTLFAYLELTYGIISILIGLVLIFYPTLFVSIMPIIIGLWIIGKSFFKIRLLLSYKSNTKEWFVPFITSILTMIVGILILFNPFRTVNYILKVIGIIMIAYSLIDIFETNFITKKYKNPDVL